MRQQLSVMLVFRWNTPLPRLHYLLMATTFVADWPGIA
jgi:hypothetical protein